MTVVRQLSAADFPEIYAQFLADDDVHSGADDWKRLFNYNWERDEDHTGYALLDGGRIVGMLGMIFSERWLSGAKARFCNLHTWLVNEGYRGKGLALLRPALRLTEHTLTDFTPTDAVCEISKRLGFRKMDATLRILLPMPLRPSRFEDSVTFTDDSEQIQCRLNDADCRIFRDHRSLNCGHVLAFDKNEACYVIFSRIVRHWTPYCYIHYVSNLPMFSQISGRLRHELQKRCDARFVAVDRRLVRDLRIPYCVNVPVRSRQLYRSTRAKPHEIDTLYSEVLLHRLTTFPSTRDTLNGLLRSCRPTTLVGRLQSVLKST